MKDKNNEMNTDGVDLGAPRQHKHNYQAERRTN